MKRTDKLNQISDLIRRELGYDTVKITGLNGAHIDTAISTAKTEHCPELRTHTSMVTRLTNGRFAKL